jgi:hypothetical protein
MIHYGPPAFRPYRGIRLDQILDRAKAQVPIGGPVRAVMPGPDPRVSRRDGARLGQDFGAAKLIDVAGSPTAAASRAKV